MIEATMTPDELRAWAAKTQAKGHGGFALSTDAAAIARRLAGALEKLAETERDLESAFKQIMDAVEELGNAREWARKHTDAARKAVLRADAAEARAERAETALREAKQIHADILAAAQPADQRNALIIPAIPFKWALASRLDALSASAPSGTAHAVLDSSGAVLIGGIVSGEG